ncbi:MAG: indole-3-glycerol phosphate synthase TrpC [Elusimicrobiota bacterium]|jgi:indole-3-glycerol phosphate synthase|nr:indole-3-glycerol phosphate synthase TrpC [Elusimicrobiota bacterium]
MILDKIVSATRIRVEKAKKENPLNPSAIKGGSMDFPFEKALSGNDISFICEIKKASPSKGLISKDFRYKETALAYQGADADAISVLTEPDFFLGGAQYLKEIKEIVKIPVLRKDFIIDAYQIYEAKTIGADAILLICAILDFETLKFFLDTAHSIGISCLVEAHNEQELNMALKANAEIIGVNNRNLKDFSIDFNNSINLRKLAPADKIFVSESGIKTREHIEILRKNNVNAVLIGEELMKAKNIAEKLAQLRGH